MFSHSVYIYTTMNIYSLYTQNGSTCQLFQMSLFLQKKKKKLNGCFKSSSASKLVVCLLFSTDYFIHYSLYTSQTIFRLILLFNPDQPPISLCIYFNDLPTTSTVHNTVIHSNELLFVSIKITINSSCQN